MAAPASVEPEADSAQQPHWLTPCPVSGDAHRPRVSGYLPGGRRPGLDCDQPLRVLCRDCPAQTSWACGCHRASKCVPCSEKYRRRLVRIAQSGSRATGSLYLLTLTAPGTSEHDQWDPGHLRGSRPRCGCHEGVDLGRWNAGASSSWNRLRTALKREHDLEFLRAVEVQKRGALHLHVIVWSPDPLDVLEVQTLAMAAGFGCVLDLAWIVPGSRKHAYYVAKYVTKACDSRDDVPWTVDRVDDDGELRPWHTVATYRAWSSSRGWGLTMRAIKEACRAAVAATAAARREAAPEPLRATAGGRTERGADPPL